MGTSKVKDFSPCVFFADKNKTVEKLFREQFKRDQQIPAANEVCHFSYLIALCSRTRMTANISCVQTERNIIDSGRTDMLR